MQRCVTLSSTEAEYVALSESAKIIVWLRRVLLEIGIKQDTTKVFEDNSGAFKCVEGHVAEDFRRSKHVDLRYHYVREVAAKGELKLSKISTGSQIADFLTKLLTGEKIRKALKSVNIVRTDVEEAC